MRLPGWILGLVLLALALASSLLLWRIHQAEQPSPLIGPARSDYFLTDFELTVLDEHGNESFHVSGPRLSRHPHLGSYFIENPQFSFPNASGSAWTAQAGQARASADASELLLSGEVRLDGSSPSAGPLAFRSDTLLIHPKERRAQTEDPVSFTSAHSILRGRGFQADMQTRRFQLLNDVTGHYDSPHATPSP